jgi:hypothetical protein
MRRLLAAAGVALVLALGGCASSEHYPEATVQSLQEGVLAVSQASAAGDWAGATVALDDVAARLAAALDAGEITDDRAHDIAVAIELVRTDLQNLIAQQQAPEEESGPGNGNGNGPPDKEEKEEKDKPGKKN